MSVTPKEKALLVTISELLSKDEAVAIEDIVGDSRSNKSVLASLCRKGLVVFKANSAVITSKGVAALPKADSSVVKAEEAIIPRKAIGKLRRAYKKAGRSPTEKNILEFHAHLTQLGIDPLTKTSYRLSLMLKEWKESK